MTDRWWLYRGLDNFFTYSDEIGEDEGFSLFSSEHFLWLALVLFCVFVLYRYIIHHRDHAKIYMRCIGDFLLFLIVLRILVVSLTGNMSVYELPLHLCSMAGVLCFFHARKNADWIGQVLYTLCLPGTVLALVFPNWTVYPAFHFITIQSFLFHGGIVLYVFSQLQLGEIRPDMTHVWKALLFLFIVVPVIYCFDIRFHTNFMFVRIPSAGSPLDWIAQYMGIPGYLWGYAVLVLCIMVGMNGIYSLCRRFGGTEKNR